MLFVPLLSAVLFAGHGRLQPGPDGGERATAVRRQLKDPQPAVRLRAALALVAADDPDAVPVLIDLLAELPAAERGKIEELLRTLAGKWTPTPGLQGEDAIARRIHRDIWYAWWRNTDGTALINEFRNRSLTLAEQERALALIEKLADDDFQVRQAASESLVKLGTRVMPLLQVAQQHKDLEKSQRATECLKRIHDEARPLPIVAVRLLTMRKPDDALQVLLDYLPFAEDLAMVEEVERYLPRLAVQGGQIQPVLLRALEDSNPRRRAVAVEAIVKARPGSVPAAVSKLLTDPDPLVRLRAALVLVPRGHKEGVIVLINSLAGEVSTYQYQAEDLLYKLAGKNAPTKTTAAEASSREKWRDAWANWWKKAESTVDLAILRDAVPILGYTLLVQANNGRVLEVDRDGKILWTIAELSNPVDAHVVGPNRVLIAENGSQRVTERNFNGEIIWTKEAPGVINVQRLTNGHTFIAMGDLLQEVDVRGEVVWQLRYRIEAAHMGPDRVICCLTSDKRCVRLLPNGQELSSFPSGRRNNFFGSMDVLPTGRTMYTRDDKIIEVDNEGKIHWEVSAEQRVSAVRLANGNTLIAGEKDVIEIDSMNMVVWEYKQPGQYFHARRR